MRRSDRKANLILRWELGGGESDDEPRSDLGEGWERRKSLGVDVPEQEERGGTVTEPGQVISKCENLHGGGRRVVPEWNVSTWAPIDLPESQRKWRDETSDPGMTRLFPDTPQRGKVVDIGSGSNWERGSAPSITFS